MTTTSKSITKSKTSTKTNVDARAEISKGALATMTVAGVIVGLWAFASLIGGVIVAGGPIALVKSWFGAVIGM